MGVFENEYVLNQLTSTSTFDYRNLVQNSFPSYLNKLDLRKSFDDLFIEIGKQPVEEAKYGMLLHASGLDKNDFKFGNSKTRETCGFDEKFVRLWLYSFTI